jgi:hypothetical protein
MQFIKTKITKYRQNIMETIFILAIKSLSYLRRQVSRAIFVMDSRLRGSDVSVFGWFKCMISNVISKRWQFMVVNYQNLSKLWLNKH